MEDNKMDSLLMIIPTYDRPKLLERSIESVVSQLPIPGLMVQVIIGVDDSKISEKIRSVVNSFRARLKQPDSIGMYCIDRHTGNPAMVVNKGVKTWDGCEWFTHIMHWFDDDIMDPGGLKTLWAGFKDDTDVVCGRVESVEFHQRLKGIYGTERENLMPAIVQKNFMPLQGLMFRSSFFAGMQGFDERFPYTYDWDMAIRACIYGKIRFAKNVVAKWLPSDDGMIGRWLGMSNSLDDSVRKKISERWNERKQELLKEWKNK